MDRLTRFIGIALLAGMVALSVAYYQRALGAMSQDATARTAVVDNQPDRAEVGDIDGQAPRYLSFTAGIRSGVYAVADLPDSRDRDVEPSAKTRDPSYPLETDLVPWASLAGPGPLEPGMYATAFGVEDCSFQLTRIRKNRREAVIGEDRLGQGRMLVTINNIEPDGFSAVPQCGDWIPWSPLVEPLAVAGNGDYWAGDLQPGIWSVPAGCLWEKVVGFRGANLWDVQESARGPEVLTVDEETLGVRIRDCSTPLVHESRA